MPGPAHFNVPIWVNGLQHVGHGVHVRLPPILSVSVINMASSRPSEVA